MKSLAARRPVDRECSLAGRVRAATGAQVRQERHDVALPDGEQAPVVSERARVWALPQLGAAPAPLPSRAAGRVIFATHPGVRATLARKELAPWSVLWLLEHHRDTG